MTAPTCPHCHQPLDERTLRAAAAALGARSTPGPGRPLSDRPRCPCGANTLTRAIRRGYDCCRAAGIPVKR